MDTYDYSTGNIIKSLEPYRRNPGILLLGLTGGIASGKSTVAVMFEKLGSFLIDFDILARMVVEPEKPSWKLIVDFFGRDVLLCDNRINRKYLSDVVFKDEQKRKELETFTHPFIWKEFVAQVEKIAKENKEAVITGVVPLLIEGSRMSIFDKIVLVYSSSEIQIGRLTARDGISREKAQEILNAQMPIDEKKRFADHIIYNQTTPDTTEKEVKGLWETITANQPCAD